MDANTNIWEIKNLKDTSVDDICDTFNTAFSDYIVKISFTREWFREKWTPAFDLSLSMGAFKDGQLEGYVLHSTDRQNPPKYIYNCGTGVIPSARGNRLVFNMYQHEFGVYKSMGIERIGLDVISTNEKAIKSYKSCGFKILRDLISYKGTVDLDYLEQQCCFKSSSGDTTVEITQYSTWNRDWEDKLKLFYDQDLPFLSEMYNIKDDTEKGVLAIWLAHINSKIVGIIIINKPTNRIRLIAVDKEFRRKRIASKLIYRACKELSIKELTMSNVESGNKEFQQFFTEHIKLSHWVTLHEMILNLKDVII
ncbi:GCN5-related N-acetyltransferase [Tieghemostelium lacteum]|uniref:GCN5-related N-acetyltransferase n=1 Tax=Tieghemostelium lacteum TaxID=361077 RepID=A0A152A5T7_TIELA|nr:GCN5-related N-acetyltransferase [Tieghemostelium lacteum]|eukprot:KYR01461.1 GCN5-related N-acetyltransferase [Tieghemostelium lacteum]